MKLIFLYGAPATGKLTVARELAAITGYRLHHNHVAIDLALALFEFDDPNFLMLCQRVNLEVFKAAGQSDLPGLIFTFTYGGPSDDLFIDEVIAQLKNDVYFVHLSCEVDELERRVVAESRKEHRKVTDPAILLRAMGLIDYAKDIRHTQHLRIDTTHVPPREAAVKIVEFSRAATAL